LWPLPGLPTPAPNAPAPSALPSAAAAQANPQAGTQPVAVAAPARIPQANVTAADFHAKWLDQSAYPSADAGSTTTVTVRFRNTGRASWLKGVPGQQANLGLVGEGVQLAADWPTADRVAVQNEDVVAPGGIATFTFKIRAPNTPGSYRLALRPVIDGLTWMEDDGAYMVVTSRAFDMSVFVDKALAALANPVTITGLASALGLMLLLVAARRLARRLVHA
jgi:hypothetical protein